VWVGVSVGRWGVGRCGCGAVWEKLDVVVVWWGGRGGAGRAGAGRIRGREAKKWGRG